ncbi:VOC family protein [Pseudonocardia endophytica]|uniref:Putative glyoxalase superfamily protein PhnB n=1 Tax=Pseudonocardia endophytica TaxID=401976 RepID=A0A4R1HQB0_PSEEN|nr:VOC family protein [Pseudonocardia endophytica]TCK22650.1 putative glyoxalase superfamily protein PhnB [Pseudonocardia endophytica]
MSMHPTLRYDDPRAAISFLTGALGLREVAVHADDSGTVVHAVLAWDDGDDTDTLLLAQRSDPAGAFDSGTAVLYLTTDDPDSLHDKAVAAGATVALGLTDQPYGSREFAVTDPEDNRWCFGTYRPGS